jgi:hypothetical protein
VEPASEDDKKKADSILYAIYTIMKFRYNRTQTVFDDTLEASGLYEISELGKTRMLASLKLFKAEFLNALSSDHDHLSDENKLIKENVDILIKGIGKINMIPELDPTTNLRVDYTDEQKAIRMVMVAENEVSQQNKQINKLYEDINKFPPLTGRATADQDTLNKTYMTEISEIHTKKESEAGWKLLEKLFPRPASPAGGGNRKKHKRKPRKINKKSRKSIRKINRKSIRKSKRSIRKINRKKKSKTLRKRR